MRTRNSNFLELFHVSGSCFSTPFNLQVPYFISVQFSHSVMSNSLWPHGMQHTRPLCPSPAPGVYPNSWPLSPRCHPTIPCRPLLHLPLIFPSIRLFSNESALHIRWPKYWEFQLQHQSFQRIFRTDFLWWTGRTIPFNTDLKWSLGAESTCSPNAH